MAIPGVGVDKLVETGRLDHLKGGPLFWVDSADSHPCMGNEDREYCIASFPGPIPSLSMFVCWR